MKECYGNDIKKYLNDDYLDNVLIHLKYGFEGDLNVLFEKYLEMVKHDFLNENPNFNFNKHEQNRIFKDFKNEIAQYVKANIVKINDRNRPVGKNYHV